MKISNKSALKEALLVALSRRLSEDGFTRLTGQEKYCRGGDGRTEILQFVFSDYAATWVVQPSVGVRYEQVERIFHETSGFEKKFQSGTSTIGASVGVIAGGNSGSCQFAFEDVSDIDRVVEQIMVVYRDVEAPYLNRWSSLKEIDKGINDNPSERVPHLRSGLAWFRCSTGLIVAKLVGRPNYEDLVAIYSEVMVKDNKGFYWGRFESLIGYLEKLDISTLS